MGVPLRMELGPRDAEGNKVCLMKRNAGSPKEKKFVEGVEAVRSWDFVFPRRPPCAPLMRPFSLPQLEACRVMLHELDEELKASSKAFHEVPALVSLPAPWFFCFFSFLLFTMLT